MKLKSFHAFKLPDCVISYIVTILQILVLYFINPHIFYMTLDK